MSLERQLVEKYPILGSSQSPEEISMTVKGVVIALLPFLSLILAKFGVSEDLLNELVNAVFGLVGSGLVVWGVVRKFKK